MLHYLWFDVATPGDDLAAPGKCSSNETRQTARAKLVAYAFLIEQVVHTRYPVTSMLDVDFQAPKQICPSAYAA